MLFEKFQNNPFASSVQCESQANNGLETSIIPGREIAAAATASNVILPGGLSTVNRVLTVLKPQFLPSRFMRIWFKEIFPSLRSWRYHFMRYNSHNGLWFSQFRFFLLLTISFSLPGRSIGFGQVPYPSRPSKVQIRFQRFPCVPCWRGC